VKARATTTASCGWRSRPKARDSFRTRWRSGFYHVALAARVPLALVYLDFAERVVGVDSSSC
jgi:hypothetical protein